MVKGPRDLGQKRSERSVATSRMMGQVFADFRDDPDLRVAIITGAGEKFFCPGWDLKAAAEGEVFLWLKISCCCPREPLREAVAISKSALGARINRGSVTYSANLWVIQQSAPFSLKSSHFHTRN